MRDRAPSGIGTVPSDERSQILAPGTIQNAVAAAGLQSLTARAAEQFAAYAELLLKWNARLNLTALRTPQQILERHFIESVFCAQHLAGAPKTLLDFGSGAGLPGLPIAICRPEISVTLAESNHKKAAFLHEAVRVTQIDAAVYSDRVETMPADRRFEAVTMRAVDKMAEALPAALARLTLGGTLVLLTTTPEAPVATPSCLQIISTQPLPNSTSRILLQLTRPHSVSE